MDRFYGTITIAKNDVMTGQVYDRMAQDPDEPEVTVVDEDMAVVVEKMREGKPALGIVFLFEEDQDGNPGSDVARC